MQFTNLISLVVTALVIITFWLIIGRRSLKNLEESIALAWKSLSKQIAKRQDLVPLLIEIARLYAKNQESTFAEVIKNRQSTIAITGPGAAKIEAEHDLSLSIEKILDLGRIYEDLGKDINFLEARKELHELKKQIEQEVSTYNTQIRLYNARRSSWYLWLIARLFRFEQKVIF